MEKIALITDTTCDLPDETIKRYGIKLLPFRIHYSDREYRDRYEITAEEIYSNFNVEVPKSSTPCMQDIKDAFNELESQGYTHCIAITLSSGLSSVYDAVKLVSQEHPALKSFVYDSKSISWGEGHMVKECAELIQKGHSFDDIVAALPKIRNKMKLFFVVGTLEYLIKGGRIGKVSGTIGELLNIKPVITVDEEGKYTTFAKVRGRKQSLDKLFEVGKQILEKGRHQVYLMSGAAHEEAQALMARLKELPNVKEIIYGGNISPVAGVHSGPGLVGVVFVEC